MNKERKLKKLKKAMNLIYGTEGLGTGFKDIHGNIVRPGSLIKHVRYVGGVCVEDSQEVCYYNRVDYSPRHAAFGVWITSQRITGQRKVFVPLDALVKVEVI